MMKRHVWTNENQANHHQWRMTLLSALNHFRLSAHQRGGVGCATIAVLVENVYLMFRLDGDGKMFIVYGFAAEFAPSHNTHRVERCIVAFNGPKTNNSKVEWNN